MNKEDLIPSSLFDLYKTIRHPTRISNYISRTITATLTGITIYHLGKLGLEASGLIDVGMYVAHQAAEKSNALSQDTFYQALLNINIVNLTIAELYGSLTRSENKQRDNIYNAMKLAKKNGDKDIKKYLSKE